MGFIIGCISDVNFENKPIWTENFTPPTEQWKMTSHELARRLLSMENLPLYCFQEDGGNDIEIDYIEVIDGASEEVEAFGKTFIDAVPKRIVLS